MNANRTHNKPLTLEPVEVPTPGGDTARPIDDGSSNRAAGQRELRITIADEFLAEVAKEYQEGHIDPALWARALAQSGNDESLVIAAYLRTRATALQRQRRNERPERRVNRTNPVHGASRRKGESRPDPEILSPNDAGVRLRGVQLKPVYLAAAAAALASVIAAVWMIASPGESESGGQLSVSAGAPSPKRSVAARPVGSAQPVVKSPSGGTNSGNSDPALASTVQQLRDAGSWNVLVLYAAKWTREEPNNAAAWDELSRGYANLGQVNDALVAATRAVELSPGDMLLWRNFGHLNLAVGRLPEAGSAFDRALALSSDDADALCGAALVAQRQGRAKDADAIARQIKSAAGSCLGVSDGESVAVVAGGNAARKPVLSVGR